jgi:hypothetical protein
MLEKQGLSAPHALLASSFVYGLLSTIPNLGLEIRLFQTDLISISITGTIIEAIFNSLYIFTLTFFLSLACGTVYIITRNIVYSIIVHSLTSLIILLSYLFLLWNNFVVLFLYGTFISLIVGAGLFIVFNSIASYFDFFPKKENWKMVLPEIFSERINRSFGGYLLIFMFVVTYLLFFQNLGVPGLIFILFQLAFFISMAISARSIFSVKKDSSNTQVVN